jgi:hypothetical protein
MTVITTPDALIGYDVTKVNFEDISALDGEELGFGAGQPYSSIGLIFTPAIVDATANLNSGSSGIGIRSATVYDQGYQNFLRWQFSTEQTAVGFFYRDLLATIVTVRAYDNDGNLVEEGTFESGEGYAGFIRNNADILTIEIFSPHSTVESAFQSRTYIDDLSFTTTRFKTRDTFIKWLIWAWMILIGSILITPVGPFCIACRIPLGDTSVRVMGVITLILGLLGLMRGISKGRS